MRIGSEMNWLSECNKAVATAGYDAGCENADAEARIPGYAEDTGDTGDAEDAEYADVVADTGKVLVAGLKNGDACGNDDGC